MNTNFKDFPILITKRLQLRKIEETDVEELFFLRSDKGVLKYLDKKPAQNQQEVVDWMRMIAGSEEEGLCITWAICLKGKSKLIGTICFWNIQDTHCRGEIGYTLHPDFHQQGIMSEAMEAALDYGFKKIKFHSIEANVNPENTASICLLRKYNFIKEAHFKENYFYDGKFLDSAIYSLLESVHLK